MVVGLFVYQHLFGSRETKFLINLLRTHPRFRSATWPLLLPQMPRYPLGRDYSVTPPLSVERGNSWVAAAPPAVKRARVRIQKKLAGVFNSVNSNWMFLRELLCLVFSKRINAFPPLDASHSFFICYDDTCPTKHQDLAAKLKNKLIRVVFKKDYPMKLVSLAQCKKASVNTPLLHLTSSSIPL